MCCNFVFLKHAFINIFVNILKKLSSVFYFWVLLFFYFLFYFKDFVILLFTSPSGRWYALYLVVWDCTTKDKGVKCSNNCLTPYNCLREPMFKLYRRWWFCNHLYDFFFTIYYLNQDKYFKVTNFIWNTKVRTFFFSIFMKDIHNLKLTVSF